MKLVYIAGRFSADDRAGVEKNIDAAEDMGVEVATLGAMPVIPHANTGDPRFEHVQPYTFWIEGTKELLRKCHAVMLVPGWESSSGTKGEIAEAEKSGIPVFDFLYELKRWLDSCEVPRGFSPPTGNGAAGTADAD